MGSFDKSFYELLNRYQSIKEQTAAYDDKGQFIGIVDDKGQFQAVGDKSQKGSNFTAVTKENPTATPQETKTAAAVPATPQATTTTAAVPATPQQTTTAPTPEDIKQQGQVGAEIKSTSGGKFATVKDRTNQEKVDAILGKGKYKAGTAEANLALADYFKKNPVGVTPGKPGQPAGSLASQAGQPANITPSEFDVRRAAQTGVARPNSAASATPEQATGVPAGTTPQQFDARRAAQTGVARPTVPAPATTNKPKAPGEVEGTDTQGKRIKAPVGLTA